MKENLVEWCVNLDSKLGILNNEKNLKQHWAKNNKKLLNIYIIKIFNFFYVCIKWALLLKKHGKKVVKGWKKSGWKNCG